MIIDVFMLHYNQLNGRVNINEIFSSAQLNVYYFF